MKNDLCVNNQTNLANINVELKNIEKITTKTNAWSFNLDIKNGVNFEYNSKELKIYNGKE